MMCVCVSSIGESNIVHVHVGQFCLQTTRGTSYSTQFICLQKGNLSILSDLDPSSSLSEDRHSPSPALVSYDRNVIIIHVVDSL